MEFLKSQKGKQKLAFEGYMYICDSKIENKTYWKCESGLCRAHLITTNKDSEVEARPTKEHFHVPDTAKIEVITDEFHNFRYEILWNHDFYAQDSNIIQVSIFFSIFFRYYFDIFFDVFDVFFDIFLRLKVNSIFCLISCVDV